MNEIILIGLFLVYLIFREWQHGKEVKLLSEAVIAKNIYEYKDLQTKDATPEKDKPAKFIPMDDISDEEFLHSIKKQLNRETPVDKFKNKVKKLWQTK